MCVSTLLVVLVVVLGGIAAAPWLSRRAHAQVVDSLARRFESRVALEQLDVRLVPWPYASGRGLTITPADRRDGTPPLVSVDEFSASAGYLGFLRSPISVGDVTVRGVTITILPRDRDDDDDDRVATKPGVTSAADARTDGPPREGSVPGPSPQDPRPDDDGLRIHVDRIVASEVSLRIVRRTPGKPPRVFDIERAVLQSVARDAPLDFDATVINPLPRGRVETTGSFGPWKAGAPGTTPLSGTFVFADADMATIKGLRGTLDATGAFDGVLERIAVRGETRTPAFGLTVGDQRVPLTTRFVATVDGTSGETILHDVAARLGDTPLACRGIVTDSDEGRGREVRVTARVRSGRIQDILRLAVKGNPAFLEGAVDLDTTVVVPPGDRDVIDKLRIDATVRIARAHFTTPTVQRRIDEFSARAQGAPGEARERARRGDVASAMQVKAAMRNATVRFEPVTFALEGAAVHLRGTYGIRTETIDLRGTARLAVPVSRTVTGWKSWLLRLADPLFRAKGGGSAVPLVVSGSFDTPKVTLDVKRALTPGE